MPCILIYYSSLHDDKLFNSKFRRITHLYEDAGILMTWAIPLYCAFVMYNNINVDVDINDRIPSTVIIAFKYIYII